MKAKRTNPIKIQQLARRCKELEERIAGAELDIAQAEREMAVFDNAQETARLAALLERCKRELDALVAEWEQASEALSTLDA